MTKYDDLKDAVRSRYTIADCLDHYGIRYRSRSHRSACPVHQGDNKSAFTFTDEYFSCHSHGCHGDVFELEGALSGCRDFLTVLYSLCDRLNIPYQRRDSVATEPRPLTLATYALTLLPSQVKASEFDLAIAEKEAERDLYLLAQRSIHGRLADPKESDNWARLHTDQLRYDALLDGDADNAGLDAEIQLLRFHKQEEVAKLRSDERKRGLIGKPVDSQSQAVAHV